MFRLARIGIVIVSIVFLSAFESAFADAPCLAPEVPDATSIQSPPVEMFSVTLESGHGADEYLVYLANTRSNLVLDSIWLRYVSGDKLMIAVPVEASAVSDSRVMFSIALDGDLLDSIRIRWSYVEPDVDCPAIEHFEMLLAEN